MNVVKGVLLKLASALMFAVMSALVRSLAEVPLGQVVFFRSAFAIAPVVLVYTLRREIWQAVQTKRALGHVGRGLIGTVGMFLNFAALARLPLAEATAISFASPLITVALAALLLKEQVRIYRWSAVAVGFGGVVVMLLPYLDLAGLASRYTAAESLGAALALASAACTAGAVIQTRRLVDTETTSSIVFYFSLVCALMGLVTLPFGWKTPTSWELFALISTGVIGGFAHILLTESYRHAPASVVAPFDYTTILWAFVLGYVMFGEIPTKVVLAGAGIIVVAGLFVLWRERQLGLRRPRAAEGPPSGP